MDLVEKLAAAHSKEQTMEIVAWIGSDQKRFDNLFKIFMNGTYRIVQRAAWPLSFSVAGHPTFINKHYSKILEKLAAQGQHDAVKRNITKIFAEMNDFPVKYHGRIMDACFSFIEDIKAPIAVQSYSLHVLSKLSRLYPEIIPELKLIIETRLPHATPAFRAAARNFLKTIR